MIASPKGVIQRYKRKVASKSQSEHMPVMPTHRTMGEEKNDSVILNPIQFIEKYESNVQERQKNRVENFFSYDSNKQLSYCIPSSSSSNSSGFCSTSPDYRPGIPSTEKAFHQVSYPSHPSYAASPQIFPTLSPAVNVSRPHRKPLYDENHWTNTVGHSQSNHSYGEGFNVSHHRNLLNDCEPTPYHQYISNVLSNRDHSMPM